MLRKSIGSLLLISLLLSAFSLLAQAPPPTPYGMAINIDGAKKVAAAAVAEAKKGNLTMAVAIVDTAGFLIYFEKWMERRSAAWMSPSTRPVPRLCSAGLLRFSRMVLRPEAKGCGFWN